MIRFYLPADDDEETHELFVPRQHDRSGEARREGEREPARQVGVA